MDLRPAARQRARAGTIGGALAAGLAGPRRIKAGSARDHFLGVTAVSGRGETFKSGGRVVKNVTGYDLCKLLAGSFGTLAAMTDVTVKVLPKPETEETLLLAGLDDARAVQAMTAAMASSCDVSGAAHLPAHVALRFSGLGGSSATAFRLEGVAPSVTHRKDALAALLKPLRRGRFARREGFARALARASATCGRSRPTGPSGDRPVWRVSAPPARGFEIAALIEPSAQMFYDWAGGLIWIAPLPADDGGAAMVRHAVAALGGHATLVRAPAAVRAAVDVFEPQPGRARRADQARQGKLRSQGRAQSGPHVGGGVMRHRIRCRQTGLRPGIHPSRNDGSRVEPALTAVSATTMQTSSPSRSLPIRTSRRKKSCAPACTAASAPRPVRPTCCSATSSIRRAGAST